VESFLEAGVSVLDGHILLICPRVQQTIAMKTSIAAQVSVLLLVLLLLPQVQSFAPCSRLSAPSSLSTTTATATTTTTTTTQCNLFGSGGGGNKDGGTKGPGMMDQLAMFKKAQEMATKKKKLDEELQKMTFVGDNPGQVKGTFKYVPIANPMDPNPDYEAVSFEWDEFFFESASPAELAAAATTAILRGIEQTNVAVAEKYATLQADLMEALGGGAAAAPAKAE
jgi:hypothetical protein